MRFWLALCCLLCGLFEIQSALAKSTSEPRIHVVQKGQRLGSIAKRYNVSIEQICEANGIRRRAIIRPGQELVIPSKDAKPPRRSKRSKQRSSARSKGKPRVHTVAKGQSLAPIAKRYGVSVEAICHANDIKAQTVIVPGQRLVIPARDDKTGEHARSLRKRGYFREKKPRSQRSKRRKKPEQSWKRYQKPPWRRGYVHVVGWNESWKGYVIGPGNRVLPRARLEISRVLAATGKRPPIHQRLVRLIAKVSDTFGGRSIRVVSGYRERSYVAASRHRVGRALDFSIPGVPNEAVRDYLRTLKNVGVGYYPNSSLVHLDVRDHSSYWVDYSGPGEPPRLRPRRPPSRTAGGEARR